MRQLFFIALLGLTSVGYSQKPTTPLKSSIEGQIGYQLTSIQFNGASLRYRYFLNSKWNLRFGLGLKTSDTTQIVPEFLTKTSEGGQGEVRTKNSQWNINLGTEYHFEGTEKLSPYIGAELKIGGGKNHITGTNVEETNIYADKKSYEIERPLSVFGIGAVAGMDYYFRPNIYLGLELGLGWNQTTVKEGAKTIIVDNVSVLSKTNGLTTIRSWNTGSIALFRLGWRF